MTSKEEYKNEVISVTDDNTTIRISWLVIRLNIKNNETFHKGPFINYVTR